VGYHWSGFNHLPTGFDGVEVASDQPSAANVIGTTLHVGTSYYHFAALNGELGQVEIDDVAASSTEPQA